jgi:hypothetical protein
MQIKVDENKYLNKSRKNASPYTELGSELGHPLFLWRDSSRERYFGIIYAKDVRGSMLRRSPGEGEPRIPRMWFSWSR